MPITRIYRKDRNLAFFENGIPIRFSNKPPNEEEEQAIVKPRMVTSAQESFWKRCLSYLKWEII